MSKKPPIFKHFSVIYRRNPLVLAAIFWAGIVPSLGALLLVRWLYKNWSNLDIPSILQFETALTYSFIGALMMGLALVPTTFFSVVSGFVFGWTAFPFLVLAYTLGSAIGYQSGRFLEKNSLEWLLKPYPKAKAMIESKKDRMGWLIFFVRISPVIPFAVSNLVFALMDTGLKRVLWFGLLGMLPRTFLAFLTGALAGDIQQAFKAKTASWQYIVIVFLLVISVWGIYDFFVNKDSLKKNHRFKRSRE
ncbi:TVP38/TMEM64 family protein [Cyclobacterium plantarum]|uniref:TVP38/TMEM64 family membrane protein n=1 Tax=Cyclobacterium plantarum TaxID=2716263 RepID=A0ABX0H4K9_9BACT|nr:VTT domain-containing protein [Cyclobacterium plantarum]NHE55397.1 VTT domain-containing protein [Cyclobacterium plantarum]